MERRLLLVFALTFLIILIFQPLLKKYGPKPAEPTPQTQSASQNPTPTPALAASAASVPVAATADTRKAETETETVVENDLYKIGFSNRGGQVKSWVLKKFTDDKDQPLELVNGAASEKYGYPLSLWTYDETLRNKLNNALYVSAGPTTIAAPGALTYEFSDSGVTVRKKFEFDASYVVRVETSVVSQGAYVAGLPVWPAGFGDETNLPAYASAQIEYQHDAKVERLPIKKISGSATVRGPFEWAGIVDQYFTAVFLPEDPQNAAGSSSSTSRARRQTRSTSSRRCTTSRTDGYHMLLFQNTTNMPFAVAATAWGHYARLPDDERQGLRRAAHVPRPATSTRARGRPLGRRRRLAPAAGLAAVEPVAGDRHAGAEREDAQVEPQRRVLEVPEVELDPLGPGQRRAAVDLRPAGEARARVQPPALAVGVAVDLDLHASGAGRRATSRRAAR